MKLQYFLESLGKRVGLDLTYFLKSGFWVSVRYGLIAFLGVVLSVGFTRLGTKELFGQYQSVLALLSLLSVFSLPGLSMAAFKCAVAGDDSAVLKAVRYSFYTSLLALPFIVSYAAYAFWWQEEVQYAEALILGALFFPFLYATNKWYVVYEAHSIFAAVTWRMLLLTVVTTFGVLATLFFHGGLLAALLVFFLTTAFFHGFFSLEVKKKLKQKEEKHSLNIRYGVFVSLQKFAFSLSENVPTLVISFLFGFELLALFQVAFLTVNAVAGFLNGLGATYLPLLFRYQKLAHGRIFLQNIVLGVLLFIVFRIFLELLFIPLYGEAYQESFSIARMLSWLVILFPLKSFLINYFTVNDKNLLIVGVSVLANGASLGVLFLFKQETFSMATTMYMACLQVFFIVPLLWHIFFHLTKEEKIGLNKGF